MITVDDLTRVEWVCVNKRKLQPATCCATLSQTWPTTKGLPSDSEGGTFEGEIAIEHPFRHEATPPDIPQ